MTQIIAAKINLNMQWDISPAVEITVKGNPYSKMSNYVYEERGGMYRAETTEGFTNFFHWKGPGNEGGYGGRTSKVKMVDGTTRTIKGPWSSNAEFVSSVFLDRKPVIEISVLEAKNQHSSIGGAMTVEKCCELLKLPKMGYKEFSMHLLMMKLEMCRRDAKLEFRGRRVQKEIQHIMQGGLQF